MIEPAPAAHSARAFDVTVVGELNLDLILYGLPAELASEREHLATGIALTLGSSSAILAHNLAALGARVGFVSRIGTDPLGAISLQRLAQPGLDASRVKQAAGPTATGITVILPSTAERKILTYPGTMFEMCYEDLDLDYLGDARHFHLSSYFLHRALLPRTRELFQQMKQRGLTTSLDTNDDPDDQWNAGVWDVFPFVDILFLNEREARKLSGAQTPAEAFARLAGRVPILVVKLGAQGALLRTAGRELRAPSVAVTVEDTVGAGDSFDAGFLYQYVRGAGLQACLRFAAVAGAFSTTRAGGTEAFRDKQRLRAFMAQHAPEGEIHD
jgi:sugar/nucleoside kinase (ribokinase family)